MRGKYPDFLPDYYLVYKKTDAKSFAIELNASLQKRGLKGWLTESELQSGTAGLAGDQAGIINSLTIILVFSHDYLNEWSDKEKNAAVRLLDLQSINLIPIWYNVSYDYVLEKAPLFANIKALICDVGNKTIAEAASSLSRDVEYHIERINKGDKLFELFFRCMSKCYPDIPDLKAWIATWEGNMEQIEKIIRAGGLSPNLTPLDIFKAFTRKGLIEPECMDAWKTLVIYLKEKGDINYLEDVIDL